MTPVTAESFAARLSAWENVWGAFAADPTAARWDAMDAWCAAYGEANPIPAPQAFNFHAKPTGGGPCPICGCSAKGLRARHRATTTAERVRAPHVLFIKRVSVCFGTDTTDEAV